MKYTYKILQINDENPKIIRKMFLDWETLTDKTKNYGGFDINDYNEVYNGEIEGGVSEHFVLDDLFALFNCNHPEDFKGHSLSVSDVVELNGTLWYCDSFGWMKIPSDLT